MLIVNFYNFSESRRGKCRICNQQKALAHLALITENEKVEAELELCSKCYILLSELVTGESDEEMFSEEVL